jgi:hypothetical protein
MATPFYAAGTTCQKDWHIKSDAHAHEYREEPCQAVWIARRSREQKRCNRILGERGDQDLHGFIDV